MPTKCLRLAYAQPADKEHWLKMAAGWTKLAAIAANSEATPASEPSGSQDTPEHRPEDE